MSRTSSQNFKEPTLPHEKLSPEMDKPVHFQDLLATISCLLGINHEEFTYHYADRDLEVVLIGELEETQERPARKLFL